MKQKIIRVSETSHSDFKDLVAKFSEYNISTATEELIKTALKRGQIKYNDKENAYQAVRELDATFRKWMRQQEKMHLTKISEELLALAQELRDTTTKQDLREQSKKIGEAFEKTYTQTLKSLATEYSKVLLELAELKNPINKHSKVVEEKLTKKMFS
ncbi:hypothetical protein [Parabacteroides sp. PF5-9]|uniref:hypothetical protein n=1 Tax=Parabacteroides sp. PF5-9 TaxID=1742404 RepID=UPI00247444DD|nr:hypothetical protein [Parabacteroides sp. PF5-9]MDH6357134.1 DNA-binding transcriptional regulator GbsR (MarR family) [Parabacteroides sp. PF5-9]